jgi:hypothetical protein
LFTLHISSIVSKLRAKSSPTQKLGHTGSPGAQPDVFIKQAMKTFSQRASMRQCPHTRKVARAVVNIFGGNSEISSLITLYIENDMLTLPPFTLSWFVVCAIMETPSGSQVASSRDLEGSSILTPYFMRYS